MVQEIGQLTTSGTTIEIPDVERFEHHKIYIKVTNFVSNVTVILEDRTIANFSGDDNDVVNLNPSDNESIFANGTCSFLLENARMDALRINFVSGDATLNIFYTGW